MTYKTHTLILVAMSLAAIAMLCSCTTVQQVATLSVAKSDLGSHYRRGHSKQCANWVTSVVLRAGGTPPASSPSWAKGWLNWGYAVTVATMQPGDIIVSHRGSRSSRNGHIMIYAGNGRAIHRPTSSKPVQYVDVAHYTGRVAGVRRANHTTSRRHQNLLNRE